MVACDNQYSWCYSCCQLFQSHLLSTVLCSKTLRNYFSPYCSWLPAAACICACVDTLNFLKRFSQCDEISVCEKMCSKAAKYINIISLLCRCAECRRSRTTWTSCIICTVFLLTWWKIIGMWYILGACIRHLWQSDNNKCTCTVEQLLTN